MIDTPQQGAFAERLRRAERAQTCLIADGRRDRERLEAAVTRGELVSPLGRMYVRPEQWERLSEADRAMYCLRALQRLHETWVFAGTSAAMAYGLQVPEGHEWPLVVAVPSGNTGRPTKQLMRQVVENDQFTVVNRLRVTSLERTTFDCVRQMSFADGLAVADSALALSGMDEGQMLERVNTLRNTARGGRHAVKTLAAADARACGVDESRARGMALELGFIAPEVHPVVQVGGRAIEGALGWQLDDGGWVLLVLSWRTCVTMPVTEDRSLSTVMISVRPQDVMDAQLYADVLSEAGVPRKGAHGKPAGGKRFVPSGRDVA